MPETPMPEMVPAGPATNQQELDQRATTREKIKKLQQELRERQAKDISGAASLTPKTQLLDASAIEELHPEYKYRYINITDPAKSKVRRNRGYVPVSDEEAAEAKVDARHGNELVMMKIPRAEYDKRVAQLTALNKARLDAHKVEVEKAAEAIVRELRDKHGLDIPLDRLLVSD